MLLSALLVLFVWGNNTSRFWSPGEGNSLVLVHRGLAQRYQAAGLTRDSCTAARMIRSKHEYLENTIASMREAFARGADVVEFDIHPTLDGQFAVFHDRTLDCVTDGHGPARAHTMEQLKALDVGYGYTADGGRTYPFRGKGVGLMPSMDEVFETFPGRAFLIDAKGNDPNDGALLADHLSRLAADQRSKLIVFGRERTLGALREGLPDVRTFSVSSIQNCLIRYIAYGWTGAMPAACENSPVFIPLNIAPWLWGWPNLFMNRFEARGSSIVLVGPFRGVEWWAGIDTMEDLLRLPSNYKGGIWTNDVDLVVSFVKHRSKPNAPRSDTDPLPPG